MLVSYNLILGHFVMRAASSSYGGYIAVCEKTTVVLYHLVLCGRSEEVFQKKGETMYHFVKGRKIKKVTIARVFIFPKVFIL